MSLMIFVKLHGEEQVMEVTQHETVKQICNRASRLLGVQVEGLRTREGELLMSIDELLQDDELEAVLSKKVLGMKTLESMGGEVGPDDYYSSLLADNVERVEAYIHAGYSLTMCGFTEPMSLAFTNKSIRMMETLSSNGAVIAAGHLYKCHTFDSFNIRAAELFARQGLAHASIGSCITHKTDVRLVNILLEHGVSAQCQPHTIIHAIRKNRQQLVDLLLKLESTERIVDYARAAAQCGLLDMMKCIVFHNYPVLQSATCKHITLEYDAPPLFVACGSRNDRSFEIMKYLIEECKVVPTKSDAHAASASLRKVLYLLKYENVTPEGLLRSMAKCLDVEKFLIACKKLPKSVQSPLDIAAYYYPDCSSVLAVLRAGYFAGLHDGSAFRSAVQQGHWEVAYTLLAHMDDHSSSVTNYKQPSGRKAALVHYLTARLDFRRLEVVLRDWNGSVAVHDAMGRTPGVLLGKVVTRDPDVAETALVLMKYGCKKSEVKGALSKGGRRKASKTILPLAEPYDEPQDSDSYYYYSHTIIESQCDCPYCTFLSERGRLDWEWWDGAYDIEEALGSPLTKKQALKHKGMGRKYGRACDSQCHKTKRYACNACRKTVKCYCLNKLKRSLKMAPKPINWTHHLYPF